MILCDLFDVFYKTGSMTVLLRTDVPGTIIPDYLRKEPAVAFQYGEALPIPTRDCLADEHGIHATLSFGRVPEETFVPWAAVLRMNAGGPGEEPVGGALVVLPQVHPLGEYPQTQPKGAPAKKGPFRVIDGGKSEDPDTGESA